MGLSQTEPHLRGLWFRGGWLILDLAMGRLLGGVGKNSPYFLVIFGLYVVKYLMACSVT